MTIDEAHAAALCQLPILYDGCVYLRIETVGVHYMQPRGRVPFLTLRDRNGSTIVHADPLLCNVLESTVLLDDPTIL